MRTKKEKRIKNGVTQWVCVETGCNNPIARNADGTTDGNWKCEEHTKAYYAKYWFKGQV